MIVKKITYKNFKGQTVTRELYFNYTKPEFVDLQLSEEGGFDDILRKISVTEDPNEVVRIFKKTLLTSYGELSPDGEVFMKSPEIAAKFEHSAAFEYLYLSFLQNADEASDFYNQLIPTFTDEELAKYKAAAEAAKNATTDK